MAAVDEPKRGLFRRKTPSEPQFSTDPGLEIFDTVSVNGIDPVVNLGTLEELLTVRPSTSKPVSNLGIKRGEVILPE